MFFTRLLLYKLPSISQTMGLDAFSRIKSFVFWLKFHWIFSKGPIDNNPAVV